MLGVHINSCQVTKSGPYWFNITPTSEDTQNKFNKKFSQKRLIILEKYGSGH
jgi:hypothetical protein